MMMDSFIYEGLDLDAAEVPGEEINKNKSDSKIGNNSNQVVV